MMKHYYKERFEAFRRMSFTLSTLMEVNEKIEKEVTVLFLDLGTVNQ